MLARASPPDAHRETITRRLRNVAPRARPCRRCGIADTSWRSRSSVTMKRIVRRACGHGPIVERDVAARAVHEIGERERDRHVGEADQHVRAHVQPDEARLPEEAVAMRHETIGGEDVSQKPGHPPPFRARHASGLGPRTAPARPATRERGPPRPTRRVRPHAHPGSIYRRGAPGLKDEAAHARAGGDRSSPTPRAAPEQPA